METLRQDIRFAFRALYHARATTAIAVLCLALGIGANTAIFSVIHGVLLDPLPYAAPERLVNISEINASGGPSLLSPPLYRQLEEQKALFSGVAGWILTSQDLGNVSEPERLRGVRATTSLFSTLGVAPLLGRTFNDTDDPRSSNPVVVLSEALWRQQFAADRNLIGRQVTLSGRKHTVIGIMPMSFDFPISPTRRDFWEPLDARDLGDVTMRNNRALRVVARLAAGVDSSKAMAGLTTLSLRNAASFPGTDKDRRLMANGSIGGAVGNVRPALALLLGAVALLLLIACANVASLSLVRAATRRREIALRAALGAEPIRLMRQLLTESTVLGIVGGVLGLLVAWVGLRVLLDVSASVLPHADRVTMQGTPLLFAVILSIACGLGVGLIPAFRARKPDLRGDLTDGTGRSSASGARQRTLRALIVIEIALSVTLLTGAGLVIRSVAALLNVDSGLVTDRVLTFGLGAPPGTADSLWYPTVFGPVADRIRSAPGVRAVGMINMLPMGGAQTDRSFNIVGEPYIVEGSGVRDAQRRVISRDYFRALGIRLVAGRDFAEQDHPRAARVVIVNDELVRRYFSGKAAVGRQLDVEGTKLTIVGVVRAVREMGLENQLMPEFYLPVSQVPVGAASMTYVVSAATDPSMLTGVARDAVHAVAPSQPVYNMTTMDAIVGKSLGNRTLLLILLSLFAGVALILSAAGVYGVMSYGVNQRRREIGIRVALGSGAGGAAGLVMRDVAAVAGLGTAVGMIAAAGSSHLMRSLLFETRALDTVTFLSVPVVIGTVALLAAAVPAWRAARVDPLVAMRAE